MAFLKEERHRDRERHTKRKCLMTMVAEIEVMHKPKNVRDFQQPPAARRETWSRFFTSPTDLISDFWPPDCGRINFCC